MQFSKMLLEFRAKHNLNQKQMAEIIGVSYVMVSQYENEKFKPTTRNEIIFKRNMEKWEENKNENV